MTSDNLRNGIMSKGLGYEPGDSIYIFSNSGDRATASRGQVEVITPSGQVNVRVVRKTAATLEDRSYVLRFNRRGELIGSAGLWPSDYLVAKNEQEARAATIVERNRIEREQRVYQNTLGELLKVDVRTPDAKRHAASVLRSLADKLEVLAEKTSEVRSDPEESPEP